MWLRKANNPRVTAFVQMAWCSLLLVSLSSPIRTRIKAGILRHDDVAAMNCPLPTVTCFWMSAY